MGDIRGGDRHSECIHVLLWHWGRRGGGPKYTIELARALKDRRYVAVHLSLSRQSELFELSRSLGLPGFFVDTYAGVVSAAFNSLSIPFLRRRFKRYLRDAHIDVVLCTMPHLWNALFVRVIRQLGVPFIMMVHDASLHPGENNPFRSLLQSYEIRATNALITLSDYVRRQVCSAYKYPEDKIWVVPHGVFKFPGVSAATRMLPQDRPVRLLFFGRILAYKGLELLLEAYDLLKGTCAIELHIVGSGDTGPYLRHIKKDTAIYLDNRWIPETEVGSVLAKADLVVLPYTEASQSGVVPAACGAGLPVVVTPVGGLIEQVRHGETGLIARDVSATALAEAIAGLLSDPGLYSRCVEGALRCGQERLGWASIATQIDEVLQSVVRGRS